jgi:hypothetical protein
LDHVVEKISLLLELVVDVVSVIITEVKLKMSGLRIIEFLKDLSVFDLLPHEFEEPPGKVYNHDYKHKEHE